MKSDSPLSAYKEAVLESAPPLKIVHMLYEGAIRFIDQAKSVDPKQDLATFAQSVNKADAIVSELRINLDHERSPELTGNLDALYLFVESRLRTAFVDQTAEPLDAARGVLTTLLDGWKQVEVDSSGTDASA